MSDVTLYDTEYLKRVANSHRDQGIGFTYANRKGKQYVTISNRKNKTFGNYWSSKAKLVEHIREIFPKNFCYVTSGSWGGSMFDVTFRIA